MTTTTVDDARLRRLLTVDEVAELLGVPPRSVYRWAVRGGGPPVTRVGHRVRYRPAELERWLAERTTNGPAKAETARSRAPRES